MPPKTKPSRRSHPLRLAIYGGTFDPVHLGHLILAEDAREQLDLDAVLFVPAAQSPHKLHRTAAPASKRLSMLRSALRGNSGAWVCRCELERPTPSFSIDTAREIREAFPHAELFWLIGTDQLAKLATWKDYTELRRLVTFVILDRTAERVRIPRGFIRLPRPRRIDISATEIRERVKKKLPIRHLVPASVAAYIQRTHLYRQNSTL